MWPGPAGYRNPDLFAQFWQIVEHYRIAAMSAVPTVYATLCRVTDRRGHQQPAAAGRRRRPTAAVGARGLRRRTPAGDCWRATG